MGVIQVFSCIYEYFFGKILYSGYKEQLAKYLFGVTIYFVLLGLFWNIFNVDRNMSLYEVPLIIYLFVVPWGFALYFWNIVSATKKAMKH